MNFRGRFLVVDVLYNRFSNIYIWYIISLNWFRSRWIFSKIRNTVVVLSFKVTICSFDKIKNFKFSRLIYSRRQLRDDFFFARKIIYIEDWTRNWKRANKVSKVTLTSVVPLLSFSDVSLFNANYPNLSRSSYPRRVTKEYTKASRCLFFTGTSRRDAATMVAYISYILLLLSHFPWLDTVTLVKGVDGG